MIARRLAIALVALAALCAPGPAGAFFDTGLDVDAIPRLACADRPLPNGYVWCGRWSTTQPVGTQYTFEPLGEITLDPISIFEAQAVEGKPFGAFNYRRRCGPDATTYAGSYRGSGSTTGNAGRILACAEGSTLQGTYRTQELENAGFLFPGSGYRSGEFTITHNLGGPGAGFTGTILQHFSGDAPWTGTCLTDTCQAEVPPQPPLVGPPLFRIVEFNGKARHRSAADGVTRRAEVGWLVGAGDRITAEGSLNINGGASITLQAIGGGATFEIEGGAVQDDRGNNVAAPAVFVARAVPTLQQGQATVSIGAARAQAREAASAVVALRTPVARVDVRGGVARVGHDPRRRVTTVGSVSGSLSVTPVDGALGSHRLGAGQNVEVAPASISPPFALLPGGSGAPDLRTFIPRPQIVRAGPASVTAPLLIALPSLTGSRCVRVSVASTSAARVLVTILNGSGSETRLVVQRLAVLGAPGRTSVCLPLPSRVRTFTVRTPLRIAVGYALGARARSGERPTEPVIRRITLVQ